MQQIGRYQILGELGRGAMGVVYRAKDPAIGRTVAVKTIQLSALTDKSETARLRDRMMREAQSAGSLSHPGIVTIYDILEEGTTAYIFMEFVNGPTFESVLAAPEPIDRAYLLRILRQTAEALDYAHRKGIVHRDIKPANIMIQEGGIAKITDFGVAKIASNQMTQAGTILGTPSYMAPEQIEGRTIDGRADQFSLAVIVYEALTGEKPFTGDTLPTLLYRIAREEPVPPLRMNPTLDDEIGQVVCRALAKSPDSRFANCTEFIDALVQACDAKPDWQPLPPGRATSMPTVAGTVPTLESELPPEPTLAGPPPRVGTSSSGERSTPPLGLSIPAELPQPAAPPPEAPPPEPAVTRGSPEYAEDPVKRPFEPLQREATVAPAPPAQPSRLGRNLLIAGAAAAVFAVGVIFLIDRMTSGSPSSEPTPAPTASAKPETHDTATPPADVAAKPSAMPSATQEPAKPAAPATGQPEEIRTRPQIPAGGKTTDVAFSSTPPGARVVIDSDQALSCVTPCSLPLPRGRHTLLATLTRYRDALRIFNVPQDATMDLALDERQGSLYVSTSPAGASIYIDGKLQPSKTPAMLKLPAGQHTIRLSLNGQSDKETTITIREDVVSRFETNWGN